MSVLMRGLTIYMTGAIKPEDRTRLVLAIRCFMAQKCERLYVDASLVTRMDNHIPYILYAARIHMKQMGQELVLVDPPEMFVEAMERVVHQMETPPLWNSSHYAEQLLSNA